MAAASGVETATSTAAPGNVHLIGVFSGKQGFAVLKMDEKTQRGGDYVLLEHNGLSQRVNLEIKTAINKEGLILEHPASVSGVQQAVAGWNQANKEMKNGRRAANAR
jgi:hypothetical protein